jgi:hypothetical protein
VSALLRDAEQVFATAHAGTGECDYSIVVRHDGGIHMMAGADWPLESLRAYRVQRGKDGIRVEARSASGSCLLTAARPERALLPPLADFPNYLMLQ